MSDLRLLTNVGAEESGHGREATGAADEVARLFALLFPQGTRSLDESVESAEWPDAFTGDRRAPTFDWLPDTGVCAWWNDAASGSAAADAGRALWGPDPTVVARVHDKAFSARVAEALGLTPRVLRGCIQSVEPEELRGGPEAVARLGRTLAGWPEALARDATLKPRWGTSGRGRVAVRDLADPALPGALEGLAARGGAILEPWLARSADYSVQLYIAPDGALTVLGTLTQRVSDSGVYRGHSGELDHRLRVVSGSNVDDEILGAAAEIARAAHAEGFYGPCGLDSFAFHHDGREIVRPVVELNARFTMGTVLIGLLRRCRYWLGRELSPAPGERWAFDFALRPQPGSEGAVGDKVLALGADGESGPALRFRRRAD